MLLLLLFLLIFCGTLLSAWLYWQGPNLDAVIRPNVERYLQQELNLQELQLGQLSWHWAGFLWLQAERLNFANQDGSLAFSQGSVAVRIPLTSLFRSDVMPDKIRLHQGTLDIQLDASSAPVLSHQLILDDVNIQWRYARWRGQLPQAHLTLDAIKNKINLTSPGLHLSAQWHEDGFPEWIQLKCTDSSWLPESLNRQLQGVAEANFGLLRHNENKWRLTGSIRSDSALSVRPESIYAWQFDRLDTDIEISLKQAQDGPDKIEKIDIKRIDWTLADNSINAHGEWQQGVLQLNADSGHLAMPLIWSWLRPLGDADWQHWLALMQNGTAKQAKAKMTLSWPDPQQAWPDRQAWKNMQYSVQAQIEGADIALGISEDALHQTRASVDLNEHGLTAHIAATELPRQLGHSSGTLRIPWDTLDLHIAGSANADVAHLLQWFGPPNIANWQWNKARANTTFELLWDPSEVAPKTASAILHPDGIWNITVLEMPLQLSGGEVQWDQSSGLDLKNMQLNSQHLRSVFSIQAAAGEKHWEIKSIQASVTAQLAALAAHFQLPIAHADGEISSRLHYDGNWFGDIDMQDASWQHLLGSNKKIGQPFSLHYQGELDMQAEAPTIRLYNMQSKGNQIKLYQGSASLNRHGLQAHFDGLHTPSFSGSLRINIPFDADKVWEIDAKARYLNRNALPEMLDHPEQLLNKGWLLRADIERFDWDEASMRDIHMKLSSKKDSIGVFKAAQIHSADIDITDVDARFTLPGQGRVELRQLSASIEKQHLTMSATLTPEAAGGMRWKGFAQLDGDFGHLMKSGHLSERFMGGEGHVLFSGQGIILREQAWWKGLDGRLRLRVDKGRILEGGTLTTLLAAIDLTQLPALLFGAREDLSGPGIMYERLQMEAIMHHQDIRIRNVAMRSSAFDLIGHGSMDIDKAMIDLYLIASPLQNLDALLAKIPLLRDILGGKSHSLMRKVYHMHGPFTDAKVEAVDPETAGLASAGIIERLISLPNDWFASDKKTKPSPATQSAEP